MQYCNVVIFSYHYLLDPKIAERVSKDFSKDCIVVFDEAHNIDNVCIESLSTDITEDSLRKATRGAQNLENKISQMRDTDQEQLQNEYQKLVQGLRDADEARQEDAFMANPGRFLIAARPMGNAVLTVHSASRRLAQGGCTRKHQESRAFHCLPKTIYRVSQNKDESPTSHI
jgi:Rad3-related DNA helicase